MHAVASTLDQTSQLIRDRIDEAQTQLAEAERIFRSETTDAHREQWPNVYRLESATKQAMKVLELVDPRLVPEGAAQQMVAAATQARTVIHEAVTTGGGSLIDAAEGLLNAIKQLEVGVAPPDLPELRALRSEVEQTREEIKTKISEAGAEVAVQKDQAFASIEDAVESVAARRVAAEQQARELGIKTSVIAAENLAKDYGEVAKETQKQATRYTRASIGAYLFSIVIAIVAILLTAAEHAPQIETFVARGAIGIPFALLGAYITSLANTHRREAWRLRHIELQIRTANPFLGLLEVGRREETLAALAIRFFPGQEGVSFEKRGQESSPELMSLLRQLLNQQSTGVSYGPPAQPAAQPAPQ